MFPPDENVQTGEKGVTKKGVTKKGVVPDTPFVAPLPLHLSEAGAATELPLRVSR